MKKLFAIVMLSACLPLCAAILWDQPLDSASGGFANQVFEPAFGNYSSHAVSDITVPLGGWTITGGTWHMTMWNGSGYDSPTIPVVLNVFALTGSLPASADDPASGTPLTASFSRSGQDATLVLTGLSLYLAPGQYWIGISPEMAYGSYGQIGYRNTSAPQGYADAWRNPGNGFGVGSEWAAVSVLSEAASDVAFTLEGVSGGGEVPEPSTALLGAAGLAMLAVLRRR